MSYTIGQVAKRLGVPASTIRFYDKHGLLPFVERDENGNRRFTENDMNYLDVITVLKKSGVPVDTIAEFIALCMTGDTTLEARYDYLKDTEQMLAAKIAELNQQMAFLKFKQWYYRTSIAAGTEDIRFLPGTRDFDPATKREYLAGHPDAGAFRDFVADDESRLLENVD